MIKSESIPDRELHSLQQDSSQTRQSNNILSRVSKSDKNAINDCLNSYGNLIWALASIAFSGIRLENAVREIFKDIWKYADKFDAQIYNEETFIKLIAIRRLEKLKRVN